jgi:uncharacterized phage protein (TIGR02216 family)
MAFGLGVLKLTPASFWAMTLRELAAVVRGIAPDDAALKRGRLSELMKQFPDDGTKR